MAITQRIFPNSFVIFAKCMAKAVEDDSALAGSWGRTHGRDNGRAGPRRQQLSALAFTISEDAWPRRRQCLSPWPANE